MDDEEFALRPMTPAYLRAKLAAARAECERLREVNAGLEKLLDEPPYVDCICPGCARKVPHAWASGMCEECATENCEHGTWAENLREENARLRAALEPTDENVKEIASYAIATKRDVRAVLASIRDAIRRRAGVEP